MYDVAALEAIVYISNPNRLDNQMNICADFIQANNLDTKRIFLDTEVEDQSQPQFVELMEYVKSHPNTVVVTSSTQKITSDPEEMIKFIGFLQQHKCYLVCIEEKMDTTTALES